MATHECPWQKKCWTWPLKYQLIMHVCRWLVRIQTGGEWKYGWFVRFGHMRCRSHGKCGNRVGWTITVTAVCIIKLRRSVFGLREEVLREAVNLILIYRCEVSAGSSELASKHVIALNHNLPDEWENQIYSYITSILENTEARTTFGVSLKIWFDWAETRGNTS